DDLAFVSPKSGGAVCAGAASGYERRLFPLPAFLRDGGSADWPEVFDGLRITGHFLARDLLVDRRVDAMAARARLVDLMQRAVA
ncbi:DNA repair protein RecO, partial [Escherichia coli]|nr:DNA repair protein RecO [Escherichia coli]